MQKALRYLGVIFFLGIGALPNSYAQVADFSHYHSLQEINRYMHNVAAENSDIAKLYTLGQSQQKRAVNLIVLRSSDVATPAIYFNGAHHGNEKPSTEAVLGLLKYFMNNRNNKDIKDIMQHYTLIFQPVVNPDGHVHITRSDASGKDPNRDYAFPERSIAQSFQVPEVGFVKAIFDAYQIKAAIAFHSGMEGVLWPSSYTSKQNPDHATFAWLGQKIAGAMGFPSARQSFFDYPTQGEFIDYAYMTQRTLAFTVELSKKHLPPPAELPGIVRKSIKGSLALIDGLIENDKSQNVAHLSKKPFESKTAH